MVTDVLLRGDAACLATGPAAADSPDQDLLQRIRGLCNGDRGCKTWAVLSERETLLRVSKATENSRA